MGKEEFLKTLNGEIYTMPSARRNYIIQRLDSFVSDGGATYNTKLFTIEHVLPQNPSAGSEWYDIWPDSKDRQYWLNRIANLVPLTRQRNSAAQNYDFETKKAKYFTTKNGTASYNLTTQVISIDEWTPEIVKQRQKDLLPSMPLRRSTVPHASTTRVILATSSTKEISVGFSVTAGICIWSYDSLQNLRSQ